MKCPSGSYPCSTIASKISLTAVAGQRRPIQVTRGLGLRNRWLLNGTSCGVLWSITFIDNGIVPYFNQAWVWRSAYIVEIKKGNVN